MLHVNLATFCSGKGRRRLDQSGRKDLSVLSSEEHYDKSFGPSVKVRKRSADGFSA